MRPCQYYSRFRRKVKPKHPNKLPPAAPPAKGTFRRYTAKHSVYRLALIAYVKCIKNHGRFTAPKNGVDPAVLLHRATKTKEETRRSCLILGVVFLVFGDVTFSLTNDIAVWPRMACRSAQHTPGRTGGCREPFTIPRRTVDCSVLGTPHLDLSCLLPGSARIYSGPFSGCPTPHPAPLPPMFRFWRSSVLSTTLQCFTSFGIATPELSANVPVGYYGNFAIRFFTIPFITWTLPARRRYRRSGVSE